MGQFIAKAKTKVELKDGSIVELMPGDVLPANAKEFANNVHLWFNYIEELEGGKAFVLKDIVDISETKAFSKPKKVVKVEESTEEVEQEEDAEEEEIEDPKEEMVKPKRPDNKKLKAILSGKKTQ